VEGASQRLRQRINAAFIEELEAFKQGGYHFDNGSEKKLFAGTQCETFDAYLHGLKSGHHEGYFEIPTGVGKTALFLAIISCYLKATETMPDAPRVIIHEPLNDLVGQTALEFADFMPKLARTIEGEDSAGRRMDFDNGVLEIHHSKRKGAKNDHRVLITTYQSQAAEERAFVEADNKVEAASRRAMKPEDFHLVIHDEAHYVNGAKYGAAAVDKFRGAIQLGVTATPEYSEDRTVANKLVHRYYELPLNTAIERRDLCHVRPMVIKTKLTGRDRINLEKAREFMEQQRNRPLSEKQMEQLYNQKARNSAIIKAYLNGTHPDTGERYLGQTGMIFAGGISHCDDFVRHAERVLDQPAYRPIKHWLRDEGLALAAPLHSHVPKDGVEIILAGKKTKCTEEQIKELHRQGRVLLIVSDKKLELGSNFPRDSFIADAVDRFTIPPAAQRMGRGFRVDRPNPRYDHPGNPEKSCAAFNVIDETTHEMYAGTPHHPIHAFELLKGAVHRPPIPRIAGYTRFKELPPEVSETMEQMGFQFIHRIDELRDVVKKFEDGEKKLLPEKDHNWQSSTDLKALPGGNRGDIIEAVKAIIGKYDEKRLGIQTIEYNGQSIHTQKMQAGPTQPVCIFRDDWPKVEKAAGVEAGQCLPEKDDNWLSSRDIEGLPGGQRVEITEAVRAIIGQHDDQKLGIQTIRQNGQSIRTQKMQASSMQPVCIFRDDWPKVEKAAGVEAGHKLPEKDDNWLSIADIRTLPGGNRVSIKETFNIIIDQHEDKQLGIQTIRQNGQSIRTQKMQAGSMQPVCIFRDDWPKVEKAAGLDAKQTLPQKDYNWLAASDAKKMPGGKRGDSIEAVQAVIGKYDDKKLGIQTIKHNGQSVRMQKMQAGPSQPVCIFRDDWPNVRQAAVEESHYAEDSVKGKTISKKGIKPGDDGLNRTGRGGIGK